MNFQAIAAVVIEKFKAAYFSKRKRFISFFLFVCLFVGKSGWRNELQ